MENITLKQIQNDYLNSKGFEDFEHFLHNFCAYYNADKCYALRHFEHFWEEMIQSIQNELKKKVASSEDLIIERFILLNGQRNILKVKPSSILGIENIK